MIPIAVAQAKSCFRFFEELATRTSPARQPLVDLYKPDSVARARAILSNRWNADPMPAAKAAWDIVRILEIEALLERSLSAEEIFEVHRYRFNANHFKPAKRLGPKKLADLGDQLAAIILYNPLTSNPLLGQVTRFNSLAEMGRIDRVSSSGITPSRPPHRFSIGKLIYFPDATVPEMERIVPAADFIRINVADGSDAIVYARKLADGKVEVATTTEMIVAMSWQQFEYARRRVDFSSSPELRQIGELYEGLLRSRNIDDQGLFFWMQSFLGINHRDPEQVADRVAELSEAHRLLKNAKSSDRIVLFGEHDLYGPLLRSVRVIRDKMIDIQVLNNETGEALFLEVKRRKSAWRGKGDLSSLLKSAIDKVAHFKENDRLPFPEGAMTLDKIPLIRSIAFQVTIQVPWQFEFGHPENQWKAGKTEIHLDPVSGNYEMLTLDQAGAVRFRKPGNLFQETAQNLKTVQNNEYINVIEVTDFSGRSIVRFVREAEGWRIDRAENDAALNQKGSNPSADLRHRLNLAKLIAPERTEAVASGFHARAVHALARSRDRLDLVELIAAK